MPVLFRFVFMASLALSVTACSSKASDSAAATSAAAASSQSRSLASAVKQPKVAQADQAVTTNEAEEKTAKGFAKYSKALKKEALARGYDKKLVDEVFASLKFHAKVVVADKGQPEFVETLDTYLPKRVNKQRIDMARKMYQTHQAELQQVEKKYGVPARFVVALWGLESAFGRITGNYSVPSALATLAYEGRREAFFKDEFFLALDILAEGHISLKEMKGSWAGAMGHTQFMPSSFMKYAQDGDGDGHKDIWTNRSDAFASIANYLKTEGWQQGVTWGRQVKLPQNFDFSLVIPKGSKDRAQWLAWWAKSERTLSDWRKLGLTNIDGSALPAANVKAALVMPDNKEGRAYLAYHNYQTLMHWNRSYYFVSSVGYLADEISRG
jgi:membrane-bound lytic murein transglycosylase B